MTALWFFVGALCIRASQDEERAERGSVLLALLYLVAGVICMVSGIKQGLDGL